MRDLLEHQFDCEIVQWDEPTDCGPVFSAVQNGVWLQAESLALLISALQDRLHQPLLLPMAA